MKDFKAKHIYPIRYDSLRGTALGHAGGTILLSNGWALNFAQQDLNPARIPLEQSTFSVTTLKPSDTGFVNDGVLVGSSAHNIKSMNNNYIRHNVSLDQMVAILNELQAAPLASEMLIEDIRKENESDAPYHVTQIDRQPIAGYSGRMLDHHQLRANAKAGMLREPLDLNMFREEDLQFCIESAPAAVLLRNGYAIHITATNDQDKYSVDLYEPSGENSPYPARLKRCAPNQLKSAYQSAHNDIAPIDAAQLIEPMRIYEICSLIDKMNILPKNTDIGFRFIVQENVTNRVNFPEEGLQDLNIVQVWKNPINRRTGHLLPEVSATMAQRDKWDFD